MKFKFPIKNIQPRDLIRRCGYGEWHDKKYDSYEEMRSEFKKKNKTRCRRYEIGECKGC